LELRTCGGWWCKGDQQLEKSGESFAVEMAHGLLRGLGYVVIEPTQYCPSSRGDSVDASTSILGIRLSHNESVALETRDQSSQIRIAGDHPVSDLGAG